MTTPTDFESEQTGSSNCPLLSDSAHTRKLLSNAEGDLATLDAKIANVELTLHNLSFQRDEILARMKLYQASIAPHRKLPREILSEVFMHCVDGSINVPLTVSDLNEAPWNLAHVCISWRGIVLSSPKLWADINVKFPYSHMASDWSQHISMLERLFRRASISPLSLTIDRPPAAFLDILPKFIIRHSSRLRKLSLSLCYSLMNISALPRSSMECLEAISVDADLQAIPDIICFNAPSLRSVRLVINHLSPSALHLPWAQITQLHLSGLYPDFQTVNTMMTQCTSLVDCSLGFWSAKSNLLEPGPVIIVPKIPSFTLDFTFSILQHHAIIFSRFSFVHVVRLKLVQKSRSYPYIFDCVSPLAHSNVLKSLQIDFALPTAKVEEILMTLPLLEELSLPNSHYISNFALRGMACGELVPKLVDLTCRIEVALLDVHLDMLETRRSPSNLAAEICHVTFVVRRQEDLPEMETFARIEKLRESGLKIALQYL